MTNIYRKIKIKKDQLIINETTEVSNEETKFESYVLSASLSPFPDTVVRRQSERMHSGAQSIAFSKPGLVDRNAY